MRNQNLCVLTDTIIPEVISFYMQNDLTVNVQGKAPTLYLATGSSIDSSKIVLLPASLALVEPARRVSLIISCKAKTTGVYVVWKNLFKSD